VAVAVGTSGWHYSDWREAVYPKGLPQRLWLTHLSGEFTTVELNNSFYRLPDRSTFEGWAAQVPEGFLFAVKASRYLTHIRRLRDPAEPVARLLAHAEGLGDAGGPFLLQLPPDLRADPDALDQTLAAFGSHRRVAAELRHSSWDTDNVRRVLERHQAACCWADRKGRLQPRWKTANWGYVRMHEGTASPPTCYGQSALADLAAELFDRFSAHEDVYVYFNNDAGGCAVRNGRTLRDLVQNAGSG
jgi:uncharacterized protein YecE (DUF72 family)